MLIIDIVGLSILSIFLLFIFHKKNKLMSDYTLIVTIILIMGIFVSDIWIRNGINQINFIVEKLVSFYVLPSFLTYAMLLISDDNKIKKEWWWFISFAMCFTFFIFIDLFVLNNYDLTSLIELYKNPPLSYHIFLRGSNIFVFFALIWFLKKLKQFRIRIKDNYSFNETIRFNWLSNFTWVYLINNGLVLLISLLFSFAHIGNLQVIYLIVYGSIVISLFYLCYNGIKQYSFAEFNHSLDLNRFVETEKTVSFIKDTPSDKYKTSSLSNEEENSIFFQLKELFEVEEIFLEPQLKLQDLALKLEVTTHKISQTINSKANKPFYDYVNEYRIKHFKELLSNPENRKYTILALGIESGFNSKASLNRVFKEYVGQSPKEFQKRQFNL